MASPLERLDAIRDDLINKGIGGSGLIRQAIQRANLPQLGAAVAESRATQAALQRQRISRLTTRSSANRVSSSGVSRINTGDPLGVIEKTRAGEFNLIVPEGSGAGSQRRTFKTLDDLQRFLSNTPALQGRITTAGVDILGDVSDAREGVGTREALTQRELSKLSSLGVSLGTRGAARQAIGRSANPAGLSSFIKGLSIPLNSQERIERAREEEIGRQQAQDADILQEL